MALTLFIAYCLLLFVLTQRIARWGERLFGKSAFSLVATCVAMGAAVSINVSFGAGILVLLFLGLGIRLAGGMFEKEKRRRSKRRRRGHAPGLRPVDINAA